MGFVLLWTPLLSCLKALEERKVYLVPGIYIRSLSHIGGLHTLWDLLVYAEYTIYELLEEGLIFKTPFG